MLHNEDAQSENIIEVGFVVMVTIILQVFLMLTVAPFVDGFMDAVNNINIPLDSWGQDMMNILPIRIVSYFYAVPVFFVLLVMVWGIKTVIKRHQYTTQNQQYMNEDEYY